jgi:hypothetical protein
MIKRINQYLITHHPQVWNTKLVWMALVIGLTHIIFFIAGYLHFDSFSRLHTYYHIDNQFVQSNNIAFSALATLLLLTLWLVFYLRNNPFKSFYPLKPFYFLTELSIILLIVFGSITFYKSYAEGFCYAIRVQTAGTDLVEEVNTLNIGYGLIPYDKEHYKLHATCNSQDYIDSLRKLASNYSSSYRDYEDEGEGAGDNAAIVDDAIPDSISRAITSFYRGVKHDIDLKLTHYCQKECRLLDSLTYSKYEISAHIQQWLTTGNRKAVKAELRRLDSMVTKYKIVSNINVMAYADYAFANKNFQPSHYLNRTRVSDYGGQYKLSEPAVIDLDDIRTSLANIRSARQTKDNEFEFFLANLFLALNLSILLLTFRLSPIRVWFTAVAAHLGLPIIAAMVGFFIHDTVGYSLFLLVFAASIYGLHFGLSHTMKKTAGVFLVWFTWWLLYAGFVIYNMLTTIYYPPSHTVNGVTVYDKSPVYDFLHAHETSIAAFYLLFVFLYTGLVLSVQFRKWYAMAEE